MNETWTLIHAERAALADDLAGLSAEQWSAPSMCAGWSVHQALGHIVRTTKMTPPKFFTGFIGSGFKFGTFTEKGVRLETRPTPAETLAEFRAHLLDTTSPPGPTDTVVGEIVIHSTDIRRPLGIDYTPPVTTTVRVADFYKGSNLIVGAKNRIAGLTLTATDAQWSHGSGPVVSGPILSLVLAMTGRAAALSDLTGDGVAELSRRIQQN